MLLKVCSFSAVLILYVRSQTCGLLTKNVVLIQRYPKTCGLKSANISLNKRVKSPPFAQHIFIGLPTFHYNLTPHPLSLLLHTPPKLPQISAFFKISPFFGSCTRKSTFFSWPKNTRFSTPQNSTYIRATDLQTSFLRSTDSVDSSDTLSFAISPKLGEL